MLHGGRVDDDNNNACLCSSDETLQVFVYTTDKG